MVLQADVNDDPTPIPSSRFLDATDDAFPSDEEYTLDIDMEQRGIDYTGKISYPWLVLFVIRVATPEIY